MANELTRPNVVLPEAFKFTLPTISTGLHWAVHQVLYPHPDMPETGYARQVQREARLHLRNLELLLVPAPYNTLLAWMWPIADAVEYTPSEDDFYRRVAALEIAAYDIPACAWTIASQRSALRLFRRLPSVSDVVNLVLPPVTPLIQAVAALRQIAAGIENDIGSAI